MADYPAAGRSSVLVVACLSLLAAACSGPQEVDEQETPEPTALYDSELKLTAVSDEYLPLAEYLRGHPCVSGRWEPSAETADYWQGVLIYPTDNATGDFFYGSDPVRVAKQPEVDLPLGPAPGGASGSDYFLVLEKPSPTEQVLQRPGGQPIPTLKLIAWGDHHHALFSQPEHDILYQGK